MLALSVTVSIARIAAFMSTVSVATEAAAMRKCVFLCNEYDER